MPTYNPALENLIAQIGHPPGTIFDKELPDHQLTITQSQRANVISYLTIKGVNSQSLQKSSLVTLGKMYHITAYLNSVLRNQEMELKSKKITKSIPKLDADLGNDSKLFIDWEKVEKIEQNKPLPSPSYQTPTPTQTTDLNVIKILIKGLISSERNSIENDLYKILRGTTEENTSLSRQISETTATTIATQIVEDKIKHENNNLKQLVEEIIFQTYLNHKQSTPDLIPSHSEESECEIPTNSKYIPTLDPNYHFDPYASKVIRAAISMNENLYVYGDTGCGKTTHLEQICSVLNKGIIRINPHDGITREMFLGGMKLINNETIFIEGALPTAMRNGLIFLVDEISFLPPNLTAILNPIGEKGGKLYIPETNEWLSPSPGFCIFATDNTGGKGDRTGNYTGTEVQNTATLDRFAFCLKMDYLPQDKEQEMLEKRFPQHQFSQNEIDKMLSLARDIRAAFSRGELAITLSTRKLIKFFSQRQHNFTIEEALSNTILSWLDEDDETLVKTMIDRLDILNQNPIIRHSVYADIDINNFYTEIHNGRKVSAIKELRILRPELTIIQAKTLTEDYEDGRITLNQLKQKLINGDF